MAKCLRCGNTTHFNMWCCIQKILEVEINEQEELIEIAGESEDETLHGLEEVELMDDNLSFSIVSCAWCGSKAIAINGKGEILSHSILQ